MVRYREVDGKAGDVWRGDFIRLNWSTSAPNYLEVFMVRSGGISGRGRAFLVDDGGDSAGRRFRWTRWYDIDDLVVRRHELLLSRLDD